MREHLQFIAGFLRRPRAVGAVAPSSERLALEVLRHSDLARAKTVVELGAGTGAITRVLLENVSPGTRVIVVELDERHAARLAEEFPGALVCHDSAGHLRAILQRHGCARADVVVSGLPWASLPMLTRERIRAEILASLEPDGRLCGFGYVHATWHPRVRAFHERLRASFARVHISPVVWGNLPPAFAYSLAGPC
ncbi:MAG: rRNA adenine N-6-methyltransferase family protein [Opitutaceae bacterium]